MPSIDFSSIIASPAAAYEEGIAFFRGKGAMNKTLRRLAADLDSHGISYSVIGGVALNQHGYKRFTEDIGILLSREGLEAFRRDLVGRGYRPAYRPAFTGATKKFRSTRENVPVEIITSGEYPGDGKPKPVRYHEPGEHQLTIDGIKTVSLEKLVEIKLACGLSAPDRLRDLADVQELIRVKKLSAAFAARLDGSVRPKFWELQGAIERASGEEAG